MGVTVSFKADNGLKERLESYIEGAGYENKSAAVKSVVRRGLAAEEQQHRLLDTVLFYAGLMLAVVSVVLLTIVAATDYRWLPFAVGVAAATIVVLVAFSVRMATLPVVDLPGLSGGD